MPGGLPTGWQVTAGADFGAVTASSNTTLLTANATINTKGAWLQLGSAAPYDISLLHVNLVCTTALRNGVIDIGVGPNSGAVTVLFSNISYRSLVINGAVDFILPVDIPAGTILWARIQSSTASDATHSIKLDGFSGAFTHQAGGGGGEGVGVSTATSLGTLLTASSTANTKPALPATQLVVATAHDYGSIVVLVSAVSAQPMLTDLMIGPSGSETVLVPNIPTTSSSNFALWLPIAIPAGVRLSARTQCAVASDTCYIALIGLYR